MGINMLSMDNAVNINPQVPIHFFPPLLEALIKPTMDSINPAIPNGKPIIKKIVISADAPPVNVSVLFLIIRALISSVTHNKISTNREKPKPSHETVLFVFLISSL